MRMAIALVLVAASGCSGGSSAGPDTSTSAGSGSSSVSGPDPDSGSGSVSGTSSVSGSGAGAGAGPVTRPEPGASEAEARAAAARVASLMEQLAANLAGAGGDCGHLALAIGTWADQNRGAVVAAGDALARAPAGVAAAITAELEARTGASSQTIHLALSPCRDDDRVRQAIQRLML